MSLCNQKHIDTSTNKVSTNTKNKCCFNLKKIDNSDLGDISTLGITAEKATSLNGIIQQINSDTLCDNTELSESTCTKEGVTKIIDKQIDQFASSLNLSDDLESKVEKILSDAMKVDEVSWCGPKKLSTWLIVVIAVSGVSLLALIIFLIKKSQTKMRVY